MIERLRQAPLEVKLVVAADKYHNLRHMSKTKAESGTAVWQHFGREAERQAWYYRTVLDSILYGLPENGRPYPIFDLLAGVIEELFDGIPSYAP
jgi:hypothetical protein